MRSTSDSTEDTGILRLNAALKHGYGFLEGECRVGIKAVGLEPSAGFLHDFSNYQTKQSWSMTRGTFPLAG